MSASEWAGSVETSRILSPASAMLRASAAAVVVLPTPPLPPTKRIARPRSGRLVTAVRPGRVRRIPGDVRPPSGAPAPPQQQRKFSSGEWSIPMRRCHSWKRS